MWGAHLLLLWGWLVISVENQSVEGLPEQDEILVGEGRDSSHLQLGLLSHQPVYDSNGCEIKRNTVRTVGWYTMYRMQLEGKKQFLNESKRVKLCHSGWSCHVAHREMYHTVYFSHMCFSFVKCGVPEKKVSLNQWIVERALQVAKLFIQFGIGPAFMEPFSCVNCNSVLIVQCKIPTQGSVRK